MQPRRPPKVTERITWRGVLCRVSHQPNFMGEGWSQIEIQVISPRGAPLPLTETGYFAHYLAEDELTAQGGCARYFEAWLTREAGSARYARALARWKQLDLF